MWRWLPYDVAAVPDVVQSAGGSVARLVVPLLSRMPPDVRLLSPQHVDQLIGALMCEAGQPYHAIASMPVREIVAAWRCVAAYREQNPRRSGCAWMQ